MVKKRVFDRGDIILLAFDPSLGQEQQGTRPAIVVTKKIFNELGITGVCPITSGGGWARDYGFTTPLTGIKTTGVILIHQLKMIDVNARAPKLLEKSPDYLIDDVMERLRVAFE